jgi:hypothetical protein
VLICLVLIAGLLERLSTIMTYVALLKAGIQLDHRYIEGDHHTVLRNFISIIIVSHIGYYYFPVSFVS